MVCVDAETVKAWKCLIWPVHISNCCFCVYLLPSYPKTFFHCCGKSAYNISDPLKKCCGGTLYNLTKEQSNDAQCCGSLLKRKEVFVWKPTSTNINTCINGFIGLKNDFFVSITRRFAAQVNTKRWCTVLGRISNAVVTTTTTLLFGRATEEDWAQVRVPTQQVSRVHLCFINLAFFL